MFRPLTGLEKIKSFQLVHQQKPKSKPPVQIIKDIIVGLKTGEVMRIDPNDYDKKEIIADLGKENIKQMIIDNETNYLFVLCYDDRLYQIDLKGKEPILSLYIDTGSQLTSFALANTKTHRLLIFHEGSQFGASNLFQLIIKVKSKLVSLKS